MADCRQCLVVLTNSWSSPMGRLWLLERNRHSSWRQQGTAAPVVVGKKGVGWGRGLIGTDGFSGPIKKEGDNKAPAGVFRLSSAFGYAAKNPGTEMPYLGLTDAIVAVDDQRSRYYNRLVDASKITMRDWGSSEKMRLPDDRYKWGVFVEHNIPPKAGAGSCIFLHVWKGPGVPTTGCTAMSEENLLRLMRRLDPARRPLLMQLPKHLYNEWRQKWDLPELQ